MFIFCLGSTWAHGPGPVPPRCPLDAPQCLPDASQCLQMSPDGSLNASRCLPDDSRRFQLPPDASRCLQMPPRCFPDAIQMPS